MQGGLVQIVTCVIYFQKLNFIGKWKEEYFFYIMVTFCIVFIIGCSLSLWYVKNELESGYCNLNNGECCAPWLINDRTCDERNKFISCGSFDGGDCQSDGQNCDESLIGDGHCDQINIMQIAVLMEVTAAQDS